MQAQGPTSAPVPRDLESALSLAAALQRSAVVRVGVVLLLVAACRLFESFGRAVWLLQRGIAAALPYDLGTPARAFSSWLAEPVQDLLIVFGAVLLFRFPRMAGPLLLVVIGVDILLGALRAISIATEMSAKLVVPVRATGSFGLNLRGRD